MLGILTWAGLGPAAWAQDTKPKPRPAPPAPYQAVDARMRQVPDSSARTVGGLARFITGSFASEGDRARAAFVWVAHNIRYDVENMYMLNLQQENPDQVQKTLDNRRGVCQQYADLFSAVANQVGVTTYVVPGYTSLRDPLGHAWCASRIAGQWYLMDPTWAAGRVESEKFVFRFNAQHFRVAPAVFIETHMPFDPLWQLLSAPRTPLQFQQGTRPTPASAPFAFADSVAAYARQSPEQQLRATTRRVEQNGVKNDLTYNFLLNTRRKESDQFVTAFNNAVQAFNEGSEEFNRFITFFNRQFLPHKTDQELRQLLVPMATDLRRARALLATAQPVIPAQQASLNEFLASLQQLETKLHDGQAFVERYQQTNKILRLMLFGNPAATGSLTR
ncbi:MAG TPA: transglutaminase domain-containing protein [Hymenobacter sp.]|uniref:transglutaminase domain-containing protein n=1 Tax=Hymenobacter sp. TaxID=1898978 RepID=UPI002EDB9D7D